ncbi:hypothetical protein SH661x_000737 [Planctomicrobium sp. SH661]|uniref:hypothetical protein n=1 Tax=Planctomicrobium sp. SH661 TaxID=3448124 RepID=UPI003F5B4BDF
MPEYPYLVKPQEPAIFVELYLPKKAVFQGMLYDALTAGFRLEKVKSHFLDADEVKSRQIRSLLGKSWTAIDYTSADIEQFRRVYFGYSLYDVNGVFLKSLAPDSPTLDDSDESYQVAEETSQVVRMVFKYSCAEEPTVAIDFLMLALQRPLSEMSQFANLHRDEIVKQAGKHADRVFALLEDLERWQMYVGLFVFGFLIYKICEGILNLSSDSNAQIDPAELLQDEIWVTSSWSMSMNVVDWVSRDRSS